jgi:hypothetical protein
VLVGWYHSHPNFGVFLSDHDQFIQKNFFKENGKITIVIDPIRGKKGWFYSNNESIKQFDEIDTDKEKLGVSSENVEDNIAVNLPSKQYVTIPALLVTCFLFSMVSFGLGILITQSKEESQQTDFSKAKKFKIENKFK